MPPYRSFFSCPLNEPLPPFGLPKGLNFLLSVALTLNTVTMAEDVIDDFGNMKLIAKEEEVIMISDEGRLTEIESCNLSLIGKFLTSNDFNKRAGLNTICTTWGL